MGDLYHYTHIIAELYPCRSGGGHGGRYETGRLMVKVVGKCLHDSSMLRPGIDGKAESLELGKQELGSMKGLEEYLYNRNCSRLNYGA